jgi:Na+-driven multidrug efflux pump
VKSLTQEVDIQSIAVTYIRTICLIYPLIAFGMSVGRILQGLGKGLPMLVITSIRILGVSAPLALFFTMVLNKSIEWVWYAMIISTIVSILISLIWLKTTFKNLIKG